MGRKRFSPEQIIVKLREAEVIESKGLTQVEAAKKLGIAEQTLIRWRKEYGGLRVDQARRFKELEKENIRLKQGESMISQLLQEHKKDLWRLIIKNNSTKQKMRLIDSTWNQIEKLLEKDLKSIIQGGK